MYLDVVLLSYREAENLTYLVPKILENLDKIEGICGYRILVVDTEKPMDDTRQVCQRFGAVYINQRYPAFGGAFRTAVEEAEGDIFLILDSDGSHNPEYIPLLYQTFMQGADLVIGSRYVKGGCTQDSSLSIIMSRLLNIVFRLALGIDARDISTDYRLYDTRQLKQVKLSCQNYDVLQEVLLKMKINNPNLRISEVPIKFEKRKFGQSKRRLLPFTLSYIKTLFRLIRIRIFAMAGRRYINRERGGKCQ